jgi:carboxyl-terminal processing protease
MIIGQRSYGKGSVQGIFPLAAAGAGVRLTTAKFYSPSGAAISKVGVSPDIVVQVVAKPVHDASGAAAPSAGPEKDEVLAAAVDHLRVAGRRETFAGARSALAK